MNPVHVKKIAVRG